MRISDVLRVKGSNVITVTPDTSVRRLLEVLAEHRIGAVVVSRDGTTVDGIASERDVVRALAAQGEAALFGPVAAIHTSDVYSLGPDAELEDLMRLMTERRIRHLPVVHESRLVGIVSIGDVVKNRIDELESERTAMSHYIAGDR
ncbi:signal transduction protein [Asanoa ishikariensis]|uniref:CBS domain-containing protein n=1 Tax=Asanoa ishikariensis TaxID=137265 RepID=A0A1H3T5Y7_9ACTN|nr:CBS domain-containing protein [Asanoa ishikariensis]GIF62996.1 signal transduction protein [Asanoa ishikariensis]SDZ45261.1 CBS domain-containing protein [Asanoa ishikariensis]